MQRQRINALNGEASRGGNSCPNFNKRRKD
nr:MAG TPA: hypothetical protein [Caudoviricetes sp.]DAH84467.1 MAG TPA: hypothetical protein [Caudoviricetes sp.]